MLNILDRKNIHDDLYFLDKYNLKRLVIQSNHNLIELSNIASKVIGSGSGTKLLNDLIIYADKFGKAIVLTPSPVSQAEIEVSYIEQDIKSIPKSRLINYYKRFGFVERSTHYYDGYNTTDTMIRYPKLTSGKLC